MTIKKDGLALRIFVVLSSIYYVYVGWLGYSDFKHQDNYTNTNNYETLFVKYSEISTKEKQELEKTRYDDCTYDVEIEGHPGLWCILDSADEINFKKQIDWISIIVFLAGPFAIWTILVLLRRILRWVLSGN